MSEEDDMGGIFSNVKRRPSYSRRSCSNSTNTNIVTQRIEGHNCSQSAAMSKEVASSVSSGSSDHTTKQNYAFIADNFTSLDQVTAALREAGLESSNLIVGIDFTKSNEWTGQKSFNNRSLHSIFETPNPYEKAISIIGKTLAPFDDDNLIPCFGFGDATTHDQEVFSFHSDHSTCFGFEEVLTCYKKIVPNLRLAGPTSYAPVIDAAIDMVEKSGGQYHVLVIIADGQVTRSVNTSDGELSPQEDKTIKSIINASSYPLSIILVGVGDGPWDDMKKFDDKIPSRDFDNFQFVNFTEIMSKHVSQTEKELAFALAALMEIPLQYKAAVEFGLIGRKTAKAKKVGPRPPPVPYTRRAIPAHEPSNPEPTILDERTQACPVCLTNEKDMAFGCGHMTCRDCSPRLTNCPICRQRVTNRIRLFT
ncbi:Copine domain-containing protein/zf-C3HC4_3 domain-containing protein [Cephalotus follicularis]|uniref:Copine domain-containing protein/zf-C3HC4_3 domain-containing protein n=1 Tax=Cephalotus follicularis TaxID=3775 RepID=A0A1Q3BAG9_CEPFO|nr:Copine domain-containing protein/zf-C3HC4_3 domain-containing protein [Cephalotus follicularis]